MNYRLSQIIKLMIHILVGFGILLLAMNFSSIAYRLCSDIEIRGGLMDGALRIVSVLLCLYLYTKYILKCSLKDIRITLPDIKKKWAITAMILPLSISMFYIVFVPGRFGAGHYSAMESAGLLISGIVLTGMCTGLVEEMIFRGLMMQSIECAFGRNTAVLLSSVLFAVNHLGNIDVTDGRKTVFLLAGTFLPGIALALITYRTGSVWSSVMIHALYNILGGDSAVWSISSEQNFPALLTYTIRSHNWLLAGIPGTDDLETALPAMIGFLIVIVMAIRDGQERSFSMFTHKRRRKKRMVLTLAALCVLCIAAAGIRGASGGRHSFQNDAEKRSYIETHREQYPEAMRSALDRNPELLDFVAGYTGPEKHASGRLTAQEKKEPHPLFLQWDARWGYVSYGTGVIGITGCGPTCLSMVIFSLTGDADATPDRLAEQAIEGGYYQEGVGTAWSFLSEAGESWGITAMQYGDLQETDLRLALDQGKLVICSMGPGDFTDKGHFIVLYGVTDDGFQINDPFSRTNSAQIWSYDTLQEQWKQLWVYEASP